MRALAECHRTAGIRGNGRVIERVLHDRNRAPTAATGRLATPWWWPDVTPTVARQAVALTLPRLVQVIQVVAVHTGQWRRFKGWWARRQAARTSPAASTGNVEGAQQHQTLEGR